MDFALKQRLIGATVLVALGVIFIPMLLERGSEDSRVSVRMEIPPQPDLSIDKTLDKPAEIKPIKPLEPIDQAIGKVQQKRQKDVERQPSDGSRSVQPGESPSVKTASGTGGKDQWLVQVGSFSRQSNAKVLRDKLKSDGFTAYLETAKSASGPVYRVRIGPLTGRSNAEKMVSRLSDKGGYRAIVLADD